MKYVNIDLAQGLDQEGSAAITYFSMCHRRVIVIHIPSLSFVGGSFYHATLSYGTSGGGLTFDSSN